MESLIPFIIMLILGSLFSSGKKKNANDERKQSKPIPAGEQQGSPVKKLKEMSRDLYKEIQQELEQTNQKEQQQAPVLKVEPPKVESRKTEGRNKTPIPLDRGRRTNPERNEVKRKPKIQQPKVVQRDLIPRNSDDMMKGVIFSEIFGPPKSRR